MALNRNNCGKCFEELFEKRNISCFLCGNQFHKRCSRLDDDAIRVLDSCENMQWKCSKCNYLPINELIVKLDNIHNEIEHLKIEFLKFSKSNFNISNKVHGSRRSLSRSSVSSCSSVTATTKSSVTGAKNKNIIVGTKSKKQYSGSKDKIINQTNAGDNFAAAACAVPASTAASAVPTVTTATASVTTAGKASTSNTSSAENHVPSIGNVIDFDSNNSRGTDQSASDAVPSVSNFKLNSATNNEPNISAEPSPTFIEVRNKKKKKGNFKIVGTGPNSDVITVVNRLKWLHISRLHPGSSENDIISFVASHCNVQSSLLKCKRLIKPDVNPTNQSFATFKLGVPEVVLSKMLKPEMWPTGTMIRKFVYRAQTNDPKNLIPINPNTMET